MLLYIAALIYFNNWRTYQIISAILLHFFVVIYNGIERPFKDYWYYFFEQLNEIFIFWCILIIMTLADQYEVWQARDAMGTWLIVIVTLNIVLNFAWVIALAFKRHYRKY